jgi:hypothetical protein
MSNHIAAGKNKLQKILSDLFPTANRSREVVANAGVPHGRMEFEGASLDRWRSILEEAHRHEMIPAIVAAAVEEYPARRNELAEAEQEHLQRLEQKDDEAAPPPDLRLRFSAFREKNKLVDALLACPTMRRGDTRDTVVDDLDDDIKNNIQRSNADRIDVKNIVTTVLNYREGLESLIEIVRSHEGDSVPMQDLDGLLA